MQTYSVDLHIEVNIWPVPNFYELEGDNPRVTGHAVNTYRIEIDLELKMVIGFKVDNWQITRASTSQKWAVIWGGRVALSYLYRPLNPPLCYFAEDYKLRWRGR